jgi:hypothetical protein
MLEDVKMWDQEAIKKSLHTTVCKVTFTKTNGEERVMHCTLNESMIPTSNEPSDTPKRSKKDNPEVQAVYDVQAQGWRSFRWDLLKSFESEMNL